MPEPTGKPVMIVDAPELNVLATIRRAGPQDSSHVLRIKGGENRAADDLIVFECQMALRDGSVPRAALRDKPAVRDQVISECEELHSQLSLAEDAHGLAIHGVVGFQFPHAQTIDRHPSSGRCAMPSKVLRAPLATPGRSNLLFVFTDRWP